MSACTQTSLFLFHLTANPFRIPPPTDVSVTQLTSTSAIVSWTPPEGVLPFLYFIYCVPLDTDETKPVAFARASENSYSQSGLSEGTSYIIVVIAVGTTTSAADPVLFTSGISIGDAKGFSISMCQLYNSFLLNGE